MIFLKFAIKLPILISLAWFSHGQPSPQPTNNDTAGATEKLYFLDCSASQEMFIREAMKEAITLAAMVKNPNWQTMAAQEYMGANFIGPNWRNLADQVPKVFASAYNWLTRQYWFTGPYIQCESPRSATCDLGGLDHCPILLRFDGSEPTSQATFTVCNSFFTQKSLSYVVKQGKYCRDNYGDKDAYTSAVYDIRYYENRGHWFLHAVFHHREVYDSLVTHGRPQDKGLIFQRLMMPTPYHDQIWKLRYSNLPIPVLSPFEAKRLATNPPGNGWWKPGPLGSPTNYAIYALAEYLTKELGEYPDRPYTWSNFVTGWGPKGYRMCPGWNGEYVAFKPNESRVAVAPWIFSPQAPPRVSSLADFMLSNL
ncbi:hypothetical protein AA313_de0204653 [Arthrobotrys entomopaga]|nr:hypothetical protein AA313_de0204653 [Arthrobotrys entomopaga]